jgi:hypothetical protein
MSLIRTSEGFVFFGIHLGKPLQAYIASLDKELGFSSLHVLSSSFFLKINLGDGIN